MSDQASSSRDMTGEAKERKKEVEERKERKVPLLKLFSFADLHDCVLMAVGTVGACVHGASVPVFFIFFGKIINVIGLAYLFPKETSHRVAKVLFYSFCIYSKNHMFCHLPCTFYMSTTPSPSSLIFLKLAY